MTHQNAGGPDAPADDQPLSPAESLALIESQRTAARNRLGGNSVTACAAWGVAWLVSFVLAYLSVRNGTPPAWLAVTVTIILCGAAFAISAVIGGRAGRGLLGTSKTVGRMYGMCWSFGMAAMSLTNVGIVRQGLSAHAIILLWTGSSVLLVGVLYLVGGVLWSDRVQFGIGLWILAAGAGSVFVGVPGNFLVLGLAGGAGFGVQAGYYALRGRPGRAGAPA